MTELTTQAETAKDQADNSNGGIVIEDKIYGDVEIKEPVLVDLIKSGAMQRLKGVSQLGAPQEYWHEPVFSRFDHSIGVAILLRKLGASLEEKIAGLLHDVSHTAFSHVIDWVLGDPTKEDYQDSNHLKVIENSDIPEILKKYVGFDYKKLAKIKSYSLLESEIPDLCADRFDYAIREIRWFTNQRDLDTMINSLVNHNGKIVFNSRESAEEFANGYVRCQTEHWTGDEAGLKYHFLAGAVKRAIDKQLVSREDLFIKTDREVIAAMRSDKDEEIEKAFDLMRSRLETEKTEDKDSIVIKKKKRYVNPYILENDKLYRLSELSQDYAEILREQKKAPESVRLKFSVF